jgi:hypothetical protein
MKGDSGLETLLSLHGEILDQGNGYWIKIEAWTAEASLGNPRGIRYSLTLHDPYGTRILGYDNAHAIKLPKRFKHAGRRLPFDHVHQQPTDTGVPYGFESAYQLLEDFFADVDATLRKVRKR